MLNLEGYIYFIPIQMKPSNLGISQGLPPELMDESRCTNRGNSYSFKSKNSSRVGSLAISNVSPIPPNSNQRASENLQLTSESTKKRQTFHTFQNYQERTVQKAPVYREIEVQQRACFSQNRIKVEGEYGLLSYPCKKRASSEYQQRERPSLLMQHLKQKPLDSIREQAMQIQPSQASISEIESNFEMDRSYSTDISTQ